MQKQSTFEVKISIVFRRCGLCAASVLSRHWRNPIFVCNCFFVVDRRIAEVSLHVIFISYNNHSLSWFHLGDACTFPVTYVAVTVIKCAQQIGAFIRYKYDRSYHMMIAKSRNNKLKTVTSHR